METNTRNDALVKVVAFLAFLSTIAAVVFGCLACHLAFFS